MKLDLLQNQFSGGMRRDSARNRMAPDTAWNLVDVILSYGAPARERGGWSYASPSATAITAASPTAIKGGAYAVYSLTGGAVARNIMIDEDGRAYLFSGGSITDLGAALTVLQNPVFHGGTSVSGATAVYTGLLIIPDATGAAGPKKYNGTSISNLNGSPPAARYAEVYKDYTMLANGKVSSIEYPNRVWFSPPGDPDCFGTAGVSAWDTTDSWLDIIVPVKGLAATKNVVMIFGDQQVARLRGNTPPPDTDMQLDDPWQKIGLLDARSITVNQDIVYWCAPEGVFASDGVSVDNLTAKGGMLRYWLDMVNGADTGWTFATGILRNKLIISVTDSGTFQDAFMVDLDTYAWTRLSNLPAYSFWNGVVDNTVNDDLFFGHAGHPQAGHCEPMFAKVGDANYKTDGDNTAVASVIETPFYDLGNPGLKVVKDLVVGYTLTDYGTADPTIAVSYIDQPDSTSYTALGTLTETSGYERRKLTIGGRRFGLGFKFARAGAGDFLGYDIMLAKRELEGSKL